MSGPAHSSPEGAADSTEAARFLLVNHTEDPLVYEVFHPMMARPVRHQLRVDLEDPPPNFVEAGEAAALWACDALPSRTGSELKLYRVDRSGGEPSAPARLSKSVEITEARIAAWRQNGCRFEVKDWQENGS